MNNYDTLDKGWNANKVIIDQVGGQLERVREVVSESKYPQAIETLRMFADLSTLKLEDKNFGEGELDWMKTDMNKIWGFYMQKLKFQKNPDSSNYKNAYKTLSDAVHEYIQKCIILMVKTGLLQLEGDNTSWQEKINNDYS